jgi:hypothetical protein
MQGGAGVGGQTNDVAGIGRDFRLEQNNVEHGGHAQKMCADSSPLQACAGGWLGFALLESPIVFLH